MDTQLSQFLTERETASLTRRGLQTLRNERARRTGLPYHKIGRRVVYSLSDVLGFMEAHRIVPEGDTNGK